MGRKPIEDKRVQMNRMVAGGTPALVKNLAERMEMSEGKVLDEAVRRLDITESLYSEVTRAVSTEPVEELPEDFERQRIELKLGAPGKPKFQPPKNTRFQRRTK